MSLQDADALVLKTQPYRENSVIASLFTREYGRLSCVARGYRSSKRKYRLEPFAHYELRLAGRSTLKTLTSVELQHTFPLDGQALASGFYAMELVHRGLAEGQVETRIFNALLSLFAELEQERITAPLRHFERLMLEELGYGVDYARQVNGEPVEAQGVYIFHSEHGLESARPGTTAAIPGHVLLKMAANDMDSAEVLAHARALHQAALKPLIGAAPLASRALLSGGADASANPRPS